MMRVDGIRILWRAAAGIVLFATVLLTSPAQAQVDSTLIRVRAASVDSAAAAVPLYFSAGYGERAADLGALIASAKTYLRDLLGVSADLYLAVLAEPEWEQVGSAPYGIPYVSLGRPWVVVLPAVPERGVLHENFRQALGDEGALTMIDNIGFHEAGHVFISEYLYPEDAPETPPVRWFDEFLAQYLAYALLRDLSPDRATVWDAYTEAALAQPAPQMTSLADFDAAYYGYLSTPEGAPNYGWYQSMFARRVAEVYEQRGLAFLAALQKDLPWRRFERWTTDDVLERLERIEPGFQPWAEQLDVE